MCLKVSIILTHGNNTDDSEADIEDRPEETDDSETACSNHVHVDKLALKPVTQERGNNVCDTFC